MKLRIHRDAEKQLPKASPKIKKKAEDVVSFILANDSLHGAPFMIKQLKGNLRIYKEILLDNDYRILFRIDNNTFFMKDAGTHNHLRTR